MFDGPFGLFVYHFVFVKNVFMLKLLLKIQGLLEKVFESASSISLNSYKVLFNKACLWSKSIFFSNTFRSDSDYQKALLDIYQS